MKESSKQLKEEVIESFEKHIPYTMKVEGYREIIESFIDLVVADTDGNLTMDDLIEARNIFKEKVKFFDQ